MGRTPRQVDERLHVGPFAIEHGGPTRRRPHQRRGCPCGQRNRPNCGERSDSDESTRSAPTPTRMPTALSPTRPPAVGAERSTATLARRRMLLPIRLKRSRGSWSEERDRRHSVDRVMRGHAEAKDFRHVLAGNSGRSKRIQRFIVSARSIDAGSTWNVRPNRWGVSRETYPRLPSSRRVHLLAYDSISFAALRQSLTSH